MDVRKTEITMQNQHDTLEQDTIREAVRKHYAPLAEREESGSRRETGEAGCGCSPSCCSSGRGEGAVAYAEQLGYSATDAASVPEGANLNLGCGNPVAIASIKPGETVLDLGSGAGFDSFLAANQLAGTGQVIGVDMTPAMVSKARRNAARSGHANVEFRLGEIEALPVADGTVDLIISNCVINLSPDKPQVFRETFRALKPGGRLSIADVVARTPIPEAMRRDVVQLASCVSGAETVVQIRQWLAEAGFTDIRITSREESGSVIDTWLDGMAPGAIVVSALIEARKP